MSAPGLPFCRFAVGLLLAFCGAGASFAQGAAPRSAIDWLSDTVRAPVTRPQPASPRQGVTGQNGAVGTDRGEGQAPLNAPGPGGISDGGTPFGSEREHGSGRGGIIDGVQFLPPDADEDETPIDVAPIGPARKDGVGLVAAVQAGLPPDFWQAAPRGEIADLIARAKPGASPTLTAFLRRILIAELAPPPGKEPPAVLLLARIDKLLEHGMVEDAQALLERAGPEEPELFRRWFDASLLLGQVDRACAALRAKPGLSTALPARIFCLSRTGAYEDAVLTFVNAEALGLVEGPMADLLALYLDPEAYGDAPPPPPSDPLTPLEFVMREVLDLPRPEKLPLAFVHWDLQPHQPWRRRLEAAERLARAHALAPGRLVDLYLEGKPPASGGLWERVRLTRKLDRALLSGDRKSVADTLPSLWQAMREAGLAASFARAIWPRLRPVHDLADEAALRATRQIALLAHDGRFPRWLRPRHADPALAFLMALADARFPLPPVPPDMGPAGAAIAAAFDVKTAVPSFALGNTPPTGSVAPAAPSPQGATRANAPLGARVLEALVHLSGQPPLDPLSITLGLGILFNTGFSDEARFAAIDLLLLPEARIARGRGPGLSHASPTTAPPAANSGDAPPASQ